MEIIKDKGSKALLSNMERHSISKDIELPCLLVYLPFSKSVLILKIFQPGPGISCLFMAFWVFSSEMNVGQKHSSPLTHDLGTTSVMSSSRKMTPQNVF